MRSFVTSLHLPPRLFCGRIPWLLPFFSHTEFISVPLRPLDKLVSLPSSFFLDLLQLIFKSDLKSRFLQGAFPDLQSRLGGLALCSRISSIRAPGTSSITVPATLYCHCLSTCLPLRSNLWAPEVRTVPATKLVLDQCWRNERSFLGYGKAHFH